MKISIAIMAHPKRKKEALDLYSRLLEFPFHGVDIIWDRSNSEWDTGSRALRFGVGLGDWHIVLQDDAIIPSDFYYHLAKAIEVAPERTLISLYTGTVRPFRSRVAEAVKKAGREASWLSGYTLFWGVGVLIPTIHIEPMLEFVEGREEPYDSRIGWFYFSNRLPVLYTNPSLVDHDDDLGSLIGNGHDPERRVAHNFVSGVVEWNDKVIDI